MAMSSRPKRTAFSSWSPKAFAAGTTTTNRIGSRAGPIETVLCLRCKRTQSSAKENPPDDHQHRQHGQQSVFENEPQKCGSADVLLIGDGLDHEVRAVADVSVGAKKNRPNADRENVFVAGQIAEQETDSNFVHGHSFIEQVGRVIPLQRGKGVLDELRMRSRDRSQVRPLGLHQVLYLAD